MLSIGDNNDSDSGEGNDSIVFNGDNINIVAGDGNNYIASLDFAIKDGSYADYADYLEKQIETKDGKTAIIGNKNINIKTGKGETNMKLNVSKNLNVDAAGGGTTTAFVTGDIVIDKNKL